MISVKNAMAQTNLNNQNAERIETVAEENDKVEDFSELEEQLIYYKENPLDINTATSEELRLSGIFNELQIQALQIHIARFGKLIRLEELQSIDGFEFSFIVKILSSIRISNPLYDQRLNPNELLTQGKSQLTFSFHRIVDQQSGYSTNTSSSSSLYLGDPNQYKFKYRFLAGRYLSAGITAEKDAGEQFFEGAQKKGFDFYSFHLFIRPGKIVKVVAIGDYQVQCGQGLVAWSGLAFGKSSDVINIKKQGSGLKPYTSFNEFSYLRGVAFTIEKNNISFDSWISIRKLDANISNVDSLIDYNEISSIGSSGLHRNKYEIADQNSITQKVLGSHLQWRKNSIKLELTNEYAKHSSVLVKGNEPYQVFNNSGLHNSNTGIAYTWQFKNFNFFGETAMDQSGNFATINGLLASLDSKVSLSLAQRSYDKSYSSINANPFREGTKAQNEKGFYTGLQFLPSRVFKVGFYYDSFKFPWLRYQADAPTNGYDWLCQATYTPVRNTELYFRIKVQNKLADNSLHSFIIDHQVENIKTSIRFNARYKIGTSFVFLSRVEWLQFQSGNLNIEHGILFLQEVQYKPMGKPISLILSYQMFNTDNYDTRIYAYEQDFPGSSSIPASYYIGSRVYAMVRYHLNRNIDAWIRYGKTFYDNRTNIGSGGDEIQGNHKSDIKIQLRYSF